MVEDFAIRDSMISVIPEMIRKSRYTRHVPLGPCIVTEKSVISRPYALQKACTRCAADRHLAIGPQESHAVRRQPVDIRREHLFVAVAAELRPQVIHGNK